MTVLSQTDGLVLASDPRALVEAEVGGKALNLARLAAAGFRVPPFFVVSTRAFRAFVEPRRDAIAAGLAGHDLATPSGAEAAAQAIRAALLAEPHAGAAGLEDLVGAGLERLKTQPASQELAALAQGPAADFFAVRSSCTGEDSASASFAGQMDTFLFVRGRAAVAEAVRKCWASAYGARALSYRRQKGLDPIDVAAGVVVQRMVPGDVSGVLFTADPTSGRRDVVVVSATWGLGEGLVSGALAADGFTIERTTSQVVARDLQPKEEMIVWDVPAGGGTCHAPVPPERREVACLDDAALVELARLGADIEAAYGGTPQDVEWTRAGGKTFVLQARPVTTLAAPTAAPPAAGATPAKLLPDRGGERIWDNSNIIESYSGVTTPMTYSYIRRAYSTVYQRSCEFNGVPRDEIWQNLRWFDSLVGLLGGQVYYNMEAWYRLLWLFPGADEGAAAMERMLGVRTSWRQSLKRPERTLRQKLGQLWRMVSNFRNIDAIVRRFEEGFRASYARWKDVAWDQLSLHELHAAWLDLAERFLLNWQAPLAIDFLAMHSTKQLEKLTISYGLDAQGGFQNDLLCGEGGIESTEPTRMLMRMAQGVRGDPKLRAALEATPDDRCLELLEREPAFAQFRATVRDYLDRYGFRCMNELKLEEPTLKDRPAFLFTMIKNYLGQPDLDVEALDRREREKRQSAERVLDQKLGPLRRWRYRWWLKQARKAVKNRENMRFSRTRTYGLLRELLNALGRRLAERKLLADWHDVYYLHIDEAFGFIDGTTVTTDLEGVVAVRKREFERWRANPDLPDRITTTGAVHVNALGAPPAAAGTGNALKGTPCCPGVVTGKVRVIRSAKDDLTLRGEILVAARTDPGWVPLYPSASGLLIERGSLLSHSAIVARELGLPTIVNIPDLCRRLQDGMTVTMDAGAGTVSIHEPSKP